MAVAVNMVTLDQRVMRCVAVQRRAYANPLPRFMHKHGFANAKYQPCSAKYKFARQRFAKMSNNAATCPCAATQRA
jgi:hypothetical protein